MLPRAMGCSCLFSFCGDPTQWKAPADTPKSPPCPEVKDEQVVQTAESESVGGQLNTAPTPLPEIRALWSTDVKTGEFPAEVCAQWSKDVQTEMQKVDEEEPVSSVVPTHKGARDAPGSDDWWGVAVLSISWACAFSTLTATLATITLAGKPFSPGPGADTISLACVLYASGFANSTIPSEVQRLGRRNAYILGAATGIFGCVLIVLAIAAESFLLLCVGGLLLGVAIAHAQNYRFSAILLAASNPAKAVSWVTAGGVLGAAAGPGLLARARHLMPLEFAGVYLLGACMHLLAIPLLLNVKFPGPSSPLKGANPGLARNLWTIFKQTRCWVSTFAALAGYALMVLIMSPTPLVMRGSFGFSYDSTTLVMMTHMVLMFAPSPCTGCLINSFGHTIVMEMGCSALALSAVVLFVSSTLVSFFFGLGLLGIGWNLLFLAATAQLAGTYSGSEGPKVQALNDGLVFAGSGTASLLSATVVESLGWSSTQVLIMVLSVLTAAVVALPVMQRRNTAAR